MEHVVDISKVQYKVHQQKQNKKLKKNKNTTSDSLFLCYNTANIFFFQILAISTSLNVGVASGSGHNYISS